MSKNTVTKVYKLIITNLNQNNVNRLFNQKLNQLHINERSYTHLAKIITRIRTNLRNVLNDMLKVPKVSNERKAIEHKIPKQKVSYITIVSRPYHSRLKMNREKKSAVKQESQKSISKVNAFENISSTQKEPVNNAESSNEIILEIYSLYPQLKESSQKIVMQNYEFLLENGFDHAVIKENVHLLANKFKTLQNKVATISRFDLDKRDEILFAHLEQSQLNKFVQVCEEESIRPLDKIKTLAQLLKVNIHQMCLYFCKCKQLRTENLSTLKENIKLLLDEGFQINDVIQDSHILSYKLETIQSKIDILKKNGTQERKAELIRKSFNELRMISSKFEDKHQKELTIVDYLVERINCDENIAMHIIEKNKKIKSMKIEKIKEIFDILDEFNVDLNSITNCPKLFNQKTDVIRNRLLKMRETNCNISSNVIYLTTSNKNFENLLKK